MAHETLPPDVVTLCMKKAHLFANRTPAEYDDLLQEALFAAWEALPRFDPSRGVLLTSWLHRRIQGALVDYVRGHNETVRVPRLAVKRAAGGERPKSYSLESIVGRGGQDTDDVRLGDFTEPIEEGRPHEALETADFWRSSLFLRCVPQKTRQAIRLYFRDGLTMKQAAEVLDLSESRVSQMITAGITRMRQALDHHEHRKP
jgi:RNA polymerase sigma factor for flagellar operon FliA